MQTYWLVESSYYDDGTISARLVGSIQAEGYINDQADYSCTILTDDPSQLTARLDSVAAQNIKTEYTATSDLQAIIDELNKIYLVGSAEFVSAASSRSVPDLDDDLFCLFFWRNKRLVNHCRLQRVN
jgi:hypothetical protein